MEPDYVQNIETLLSLPGGIVLVSSYLAGLGISPENQSRYAKFGWLIDLGHGAMIKFGNFVTWDGGVYALQEQENLDVHIGGLTAVEVAGYSHYGRTSVSPVFLFGGVKTSLPKWFEDYKWEAPIRYVKTSFLPPDLQIITHRYREVEVKLSSPERAMLECLFLVPNRMDFGECFYLMASAGTFRPNAVEELLKKCGSEKVKRRFLHLARKAGHRWVKYLNIEN